MIDGTFSFLPLRCGEIPEAHCARASAHARVSSRCGWMCEVRCQSTPAPRGAASSFRWGRPSPPLTAAGIRHGCPGCLLPHPPAALRLWCIPCERRYQALRVRCASGMLAPPQVPPARSPSGGAGGVGSLPPPFFLSCPGWVLGRVGCRGLTRALLSGVNICYVMLLCWGV